MSLMRCRCLRLTEENTEVGVAVFEGVASAGVFSVVVDEAFVVNDVFVVDEAFVVNDVFVVGDAFVVDDAFVVSDVFVVGDVFIVDEIVSFGVVNIEGTWSRAGGDGGDVGGGGEGSEMLTSSPL